MSNRPLSRTLTPGVKESFSVVFPDRMANFVFSHRGIIAGGAVRDSLTNRMVKDVDVFLHKDLKRHIDTSAWTKMGKEEDDDGLGAVVAGALGVSTGSSPQWFNPAGFSAKSTAVKVKSTDYGNNHVDEVYEIDDWKDMDFPVNVVFLDIDPVEYVTKHFDLGICKAWYDGDYIRTHSDFINDVNNNTITCTLTAEAIKGEYGNLQRGINKISDHARRLLRKYKGFQIVMPTV